MEDLTEERVRTVEHRLMSLEAMLDKINHDSRLALGEVRRALKYNKPHRQTTVNSFLDRPKWKTHTKDRRPDKCQEDP